MKTQFEQVEFNFNLDRQVERKSWPFVLWKTEATYRSKIPKAEDCIVG